MRRLARTVGRIAALVALSRATESAAQPTARFLDSEKPRPAAARASAAPGSWATDRARALTAKAERYATRGDAALALAAYNDAIRTDGTFGPAFLGLARVREALADFGEAERIYQMAVQLPDAAPEAWARRAALFKHTGRDTEALRALETAVRLEPSNQNRLRELGSWYAELRAWPAALAAARQLLSQLEANPTTDEELTAARVQVQALSALAADTDPVLSGSKHSSWVRRALSRVARRTSKAAGP